jgi:hypothetical protein
VLKVIHGYFTSLKAENDFSAANSNFENVTAAVLAYYTLNDL